MKVVAILVEDLYEELELWYPYYRLREAGFDTALVGPEKRVYRGKTGGYPAAAVMTFASADPARLAGVVIPGGYAPDRLRRHPEALELVRALHEQRRLVAAICHAGWVLISAGIVEGRKVTSFSSIKDDMVNAGGIWLDEEAVIDGTLVTSRVPADLPAFSRAMLSVLGKP